MTLTKREAIDAVNAIWVGTGRLVTTSVTYRQIDETTALAAAVDSLRAKLDRDEKWQSDLDTLFLQRLSQWLTDRLMREQTLPPPMSRNARRARLRADHHALEKVQSRTVLAFIEQLKQESEAE